MVETALVSHSREAKRKSETRSLRGDGKVPAILYGKGVKNLPIYVDAKDIELILGSESGKNTIINMALPDNKKVRAMIREVQKNPMRGDILHIDFHHISLKDKIHAEVPVTLTGEAIGVEKGGILQHGLRAVEVTCLPVDIPEKLELAVDRLEIGGHVTVAEVEAPAGVTIVSDPETVLVSVVAPRLDVEPGAVEVKEPELITRERDEKEYTEPEAEAGMAAPGEAEVERAEGKQEVLV